MKITSEIITSRKNPLILLAASLSEKKYREQNGLSVQHLIALNPGLLSDFFFLLLLPSE